MLCWFFIDVHVDWINSSNIHELIEPVITGEWLGRGNNAVTPHTAVSRHLPTLQVSRSGGHTGCGWRSGVFDCLSPPPSHPTHILVNRIHEWHLICPSDHWRVRAARAGLLTGLVVCHPGTHVEPNARAGQWGSARPDQDRGARARSDGQAPERAPGRQRGAQTHRRTAEGEKGQQDQGGYHHRGARSHIQVSDRKVGTGEEVWYRLEAIGTYPGIVGSRFVFYGIKKIASILFHINVDMLPNFNE